MISFFSNPYNYVSSNPRSKYKYLLLFFNWFFQGYFNKDKTEALYKLIIELCIITLSYYGLKLIINSVNTIIIFLFSLLLSHTITWIITGCIWCVLRPKYGLQVITNGSQFNINTYIKRLLIQLNDNKSIERCIVFGSLSKGRFHLGSDIDVAIIRRKGFLNSVSAYRFILYERFYAFSRIIPLDILLFDSIDSFDKIADEEGLTIYRRKEFVTWDFSEKIVVLDEK